MIRARSLGAARAAAPVLAAPVLAGAVLVASVLAGSAFAEPQRLSAAWEAAIGEDEALAPAARAQLQIFAYHAAAAKLCEGFSLDAQGIAEAAKPVVAEALAGLEGEERAMAEADLMIDIGTAHGLFLAEGSLEPERFCADAAAAREDPAYEDLWR